MCLFKSPALCPGEHYMYYIPSQHYIWCFSEEEWSPITLEMILEFASKASTVPPLGFPHRPQIEFLHESNKIFWEANTCLVVLRLPVHTDYESFKKYMKEGVLQAPTFLVLHKQPVSVTAHSQLLKRKNFVGKFEICC